MAWGEKEKDQWRSEQRIQRSYQEDVLTKIHKLKSKVDVIQYGTLSYEKDFPVFLLKSKNIDAQKPYVLITGGVHGYETSGVHGALKFMEEKVDQYEDHFNIICAPCISPWGYETINRWNPLAIDPNRSFRENSDAQECALFLAAMKPFKFLAHIDLHETTDTDNTIFRPALEARDGKPQELTEIPDGFYLVGNTLSPQREFQRAIIESVKKVTHIAPPDSEGRIIGVPIDSEGVIFYDMKKLSLCGGFSDAKFSTTTEVYPDSPKVDDKNCQEAQVAAITGGLDFLIHSL
jgi:hypothetical protein